MDRFIDFEKPNFQDDQSYALIIFGLSDVIIRKIYPALWRLYKTDNLLPENLIVVGYGADDLNERLLYGKYRSYLQVDDGDNSRLKKFRRCANYYVRGHVDVDDDYDRLRTKLIELEKPYSVNNRIFYSAISFSSKVVANIDDNVNGGFFRIVTDEQFIIELNRLLLNRYREDQLYLIDRYLADDTMQNLLLMKFENVLTDHFWNTDAIAAVFITWKKIETDDRRYGIVDNVLLQMIRLIFSIAAELPISLDEARRERIKVAELTLPVRLNRTILGRYNDKKGPPTYVLTRVRIDNERWRNVPFIVECGEGLNENLVDVRVRYRLDDTNNDAVANEFVVRFTPESGAYVKFNIKSPTTLEDVVEQTDLRIRYDNDNDNDRSSYRNILRDAFRGSIVNFVHPDELEQSRRIVEPILNEIDRNEIDLHIYKYGSKGPTDSERFLSGIVVR